MSLVFANAFRKNIIGADRSGDRNYAKVSLPLVDRHGNVEKYWIFAEVGNTIPSEVKRAFSEDERGQCITKESKIGEFVYKIIFKGKEFENIQFYTTLEGGKEGLPYIIVDGKAYFPGGDEMIVTENLKAIRIQDDTKFGTSDLPSYIRLAGGGSCPTSEQKALDLKLKIWNSAGEDELKVFSAAEKAREPAISEIQFVGLYLDVMHPLDVLRAPALFGDIAANDVEGVKVKEISQIVQGFAAAGQKGGDYCEDDGPKFRRYDRVVRKFNAAMKRRLDLLAAQNGPAVQHAEQPVVFMPRKPAEKRYEKGEKPLPAAAHTGLSSQPKGEIPLSGSVNAEKPKLAKPAKRKRKKPISESGNKTCQLKQDKAIRQTAEKQKAAKIVLPTVSGHLPNAKTRKKGKIQPGVARSDVFKKAEEPGLNRKKTGPKGASVSRSGFSVPKRKAFEPLTYGCPKQPVSGTRNRKQETVRVRRSGQAELRAREKEIKTDLPKTDKRSKGIMLTEKNKKRKEKAPSPASCPKPVPAPTSSIVSARAKKHAKTGPAFAAGINSVSPFATRTGTNFRKNLCASDLRIVRFPAMPERQSASRTTGRASRRRRLEIAVHRAYAISNTTKSKKMAGRSHPVNSKAERLAENGKSEPEKSKKQAEKRITQPSWAKRRGLSERQRTLWVTGFSTLFSRRYPRAGRRAA